MKQSNIIILLIILMGIINTKALAHDIEVVNANGKTIYYVWANNKTELSVSYIGKDYRNSNYSGSIVIPESIDYNGKTYYVTSIGESAFYCCWYLTSVDIPNGVTSIGEYAFTGCHNLTSIKIPNSVKSIGKFAFSSTGLTSFTIPNNVTSIGNYAFSSCSELTCIISEINQPFKIDDSVFNNLPKYACLIVPKGKKTSYQDLAGWKKINIVELGEGGEIGQEFESDCLLYTISENNTDCILVGARNVSNELVIPSQITFNGKTYNVTSIDKNALKDYNELTSITIPSSVTSIGDYAFQGCSGLTSITIPCSVTSIGDYAFLNCSGLTSVTIPNSVTSIGDHAFQGCSNLTSVSIPNSVTSIDSYAFYGCSSLTNLVIPPSVTDIGYSAFEKCTSLTSIFVPASVTSIGGKAFVGCENLTEVTIDSNAFLSKEFTSVYSISQFFGNQVRTYIIGDNVKEIGEYAFYKCYGIKSITISNSVITIGNNAFMGCSGLKTIDISNSVTTIGYSAFRECTNMESFTIPNSMAIIGNYLFADCKKLKTISVPNSVNTIESYAFAGCTSLESIDIPSTVTNIGFHAFYGCTGLMSISIPQSVTKIESGVFMNCSNLKAIVIPNGVTTIGWESFLNCSSLKSIIIPGTVTNIVTDAFSGCIGTESVSFLHNKEELDKLNWSSQSASDFKGPKETCLLFSEDVKSKTDRSYFRYRPDAFSFWMVENPSCFEGINEEGYIEGHFVKMTVGNDPIWLPVNGKVDGNNYSLTGRASFTGYKSIQASLLDGSIEGILDLTEVNSRSDGSGNKYKIISIGFEAFRGMPITQVTLPETLQELGGSSLRETNLKYVVIPNSLTSIGGTINKTSDQFRGCTNLKTVVLGKSVESIGEVVFSKCDNLEMVVSLPMTPPALDESTFRYSLTTETTFEGHPYGIIVHNDALEKYQNAEYWKDLVYFQTFESTPVYLIADTLNLKGSSARILFYPIDEAHNYGEISNGEEFVINGLEPETSTCDMKIDWITKDGNFGTAILNVETSAFSIETKDAKALSTTKARLIASTDEYDDMTHYGFEWKRYNAPEDSPANKVSAPLYNGQIVGTLNKLKDDVYYKYRPFYTSDSGNTYYGEWKTFFTGDADVYFEPEVYTKDAADITKVSALLAGVWFEGTDDIEEKGFEYWTVSNNKTRAVGSDAKKVIVSGNSNMLTTTLEGLKAGIEYGYRSYAKTVSGTTYGEEKTFRTILIGDVNGDGEVNEADVNDIASHILGQTPTGFIMKMADVNNDKKINAADIVEIVNIMK